MASIRQDVETLKQANSLQGGNLTTPDPGSAGRPSELGPHPLPTPDNDDSEIGLSTPEPDSRNHVGRRHGDPTRRDTHRNCSNHPGGASVRTDQPVSWPGVLRRATPKWSKKAQKPIHATKEWANKRLFQDTRMANQCASSTKTLDKTPHTIQGRVVEAVPSLPASQEC